MSELIIIINRVNVQDVDHPPLCGKFQTNFSYFDGFYHTYTIHPNTLLRNMISPEIGEMFQFVDNISLLAAVH